MLPTVFQLKEERGGKVERPTKGEEEVFHLESKPATSPCNPSSNSCLNFLDSGILFTA
jgi:hypothetical protein